MHTIYKQISLFLIAAPLLTSCTDTIDVDLPNGGARLVVEGSINWEKGTTGENQIIKLNTSTAFFDANTDVPAIGANVKVIKENDGAEFKFLGQGNGEYIANNFIPELNQSYSLEIFFNGKTYSATETLISVVDIAEVEQTTSKGDSDTDTEVTFYFNDPANAANYYLGQLNTSNNSGIDLEPLEDSFTDGSRNFMEFENENYVTGDVLGFSLHGISEQYYNFFNLLRNQSEAEGNGPFQTTPVQLKGNCKNLTDPNEEVLGYFKLSEVVRTTYVIN